MTPVLPHPLTDAGGLGLLPYSIALGAVVLVAAAYAFVPATPEEDDAAQRDGFADVDRPLGRARRITRAVSLVVVLLCVYAGRFGSADGLSNITPPLVVGVAWPALVVGSLLVRRLWRWVDPWDAAARALEPLASGSAPPADEGDDAGNNNVEEADAGDIGGDAASPAVAPAVWGAVVSAAVVVYFLVARVDSTQPRTIGVALAAYTIAAVALGIGAGRRVLAGAEVFGLTSRWAGELRDGLGRRWSVPAGAEVVLGVVAGGLLLDLARRSGAYVDVLDAIGARRHATGNRALIVALMVSCAAAAGVLALAERAGARRGLAGGVAVAVLPVVLALLVVAKLRRLLVSVQLLPIVASDPLGRGWDLFGTAGGIVDPNPFGTPAQRWIAVAAVTVAGVAGAIALRRRTGDRAARDAASYALYLLVAVSALAVTTAV